MAEARQKMGVIVATALSVTIVVGAGLLALPGISYARAGRYGYLPWIIVAVLMLPLLAIFAWFGRHHPNAGGIVGYVRASLGARAAASCEVIVLGTFTLGIPAIALIGAGYLQQATGPVSVTPGALGIVTLAFVAGLVGLRVSGPIQTGIATVIVAGLVSIGAGFCFSHVSALSTTVMPPLADIPWHGVARAVPVILFAFTGWEMSAFLAQDMKNPRSDLPRSIWASFVIVSALYLFIAWIVAANASADGQWQSAPVAQMAKDWLGETGGKWVASIAVLLVATNVMAAFLSASRAIFSAGREGLLPRFIGKTSARQMPIRATVATYLVFVAVILVAHTGMIGVDTLLQLAGQNFFVLYLLAATGYTVIHRKNARRWTGYLAMLAVLGMMLLFSFKGLIYCGSLAATGFWFGRPARGVSHYG